MNFIEIDFSKKNKQYQKKKKEVSIVKVLYRIISSAACVEVNVMHIKVILHAMKKTYYSFFVDFK